MSQKREWDLTSTHSLALGAEWIRAKAGALCVVIVRVNDSVRARFGLLRLFERIGVGRLDTQHVQTARSQFDPDVTPAPAANIFLRGGDIGISSAQVAQQQEQSRLIAHRGVRADDGPPIHIKAANVPHSAKREFDKNAYSRSLAPCREACLEVSRGFRLQERSGLARDKGSPIPYEFFDDRQTALKQIGSGVKLMRLILALVMLECIEGVFEVARLKRIEFGFGSADLTDDGLELERPGVAPDKRGKNEFLELHRLPPTASLANVLSCVRNFSGVQA